LFLARKEQKEKVCNQEKQPLLSPISFLLPLLTKLNTAPGGRRTLFSITKQAKKKKNGAKRQ
jgi:hypothetical protein